MTLFFNDEQAARPWLMLNHAQVCFKESVIEAIHRAGGLMAYYRQCEQRGWLPSSSISTTALMKWGELPNHHVITCLDQHYPPLLKTIARPPLMLYVKGDYSLLSAFQLAVVGSRQPTVSGCDQARWFAAQLADQGCIITSGLALGIDALAHQAALSRGRATVAVLANGLARVYPQAHSALAKQVVAHGCLVSEMPLDTPPRAALFPLRNRIISGLSTAVLVVEAKERSGSLITAREAVDQGREVFVVPGSIGNQQKRGCHALIRQGACLVEHPKEIMQSLGLPWQNISAHSRQEGQITLDPDHQLLLACLSGEEAMTIDQLVVATGQSLAEVQSGLMALELRECVVKVQQGYCKKVYD